MYFVLRLPTIFPKSSSSQHLWSSFQDFKRRINFLSIIQVAMDPPPSRGSDGSSLYPHQSSNESIVSPSVTDTTDTQYEDPHELHQIPTRPVSCVSHVSQPQLSTIITTCSTVTRDPSYEVDWEENDPENPLNWPMWYKGYIIFILSYSTLVT